MHRYGIGCYGWSFWHNWRSCKPILGFTVRCLNGDVDCTVAYLCHAGCPHCTVASFAQPNSTHRHITPNLKYIATSLIHAPPFFAFGLLLHRNWYGTFNTGDFGVGNDWALSRTYLIFKLYLCVPCTIQCIIYAIISTYSPSYRMSPTIYILVQSYIGSSVSNLWLVEGFLRAQPS